MSSLDALLSIHQEVVTALDARVEEVKRREDVARSVLVECQSERRQLEEERSQLVRAEMIYRRQLGGDTHLAPPDTNQARPRFVIEDGIPLPQPRSRARIGPQRFRMLSILRELGGSTSIEEIASLTDLSHRRVRDQMNSDAQAGNIIEQPPGRFALSNEGADLLARFIAYKVARNEALPSLNGPLPNSEQHELDGEEETAAMRVERERGAGGSDIFDISGGSAKPVRHSPEM